MQALYRPDKFSCTDHIKLKEYFTRFASLCSGGEGLLLGISPEFARKKFFALQGHDREIKHEISLKTSIDLLTADSNKDTKQVSLKSSKKQKGLRTTEIRRRKKQLFPLLKGRPPRIEAYANTAGSSNDAQGDILPGKEFAVSVRIYQPTEFNYNGEKPNSYHNLKFSHEIVVLGCNTLADLRDKILCFNDTGIFTEIEDPFKPPSTVQHAKQQYPSGFIFIDDTFYNDFRHPESIDYSEVILEWAKKKQIEPLHVATVDKTRIDQLTPRFGYPYVYLHQGKCEHIMVFTDAWLLMNSNGIKLSDYPMYQGVHRFHSKLCILCNCLTAQWMVLESDRLPHIRSFLCSECMFSYLYKDGQKVGNFKVYQFYDKNLIM